MRGGVSISPSSPATRPKFRLITLSDSFRFPWDISPSASWMSVLVLCSTTSTKSRWGARFDFSSLLLGRRASCDTTTSIAPPSPKSRQSQLHSGYTSSWWTAWNYPRWVHWATPTPRSSNWISKATQRKQRKLSQRKTTLFGIMSIPSTSPMVAPINGENRRSSFQSLTKHDLAQTISLAAALLPCPTSSRTRSCPRRSRCSRRTSRHPPPGRSASSLFWSTRSNASRLARCSSRTHSRVHRATRFTSTSRSSVV
mmetsp:Transcript_21343/g.46487  ORF Transcript_21343/g.46487 Transcript_21343/m.46487 type:complete len:255 (-) Transcript_21343:1523-2287(-)